MSDEELSRIVERCRAARVPEEDCAVIEMMGNTMGWLARELDAQTLTVARLRHFLGIRTSEKSKDVLPAADVGASGAAAATESQALPAHGQDAPRGKDGDASPRRRGHGRNAAAVHEGAERLTCEHESLSNGDPCPFCKGRVYLGPPRQLLWFDGQAPIKATVAELQSLRCNLCGEVFTAAPPSGNGRKHLHGCYSISAAAMIAIMKYGSGVPFKRIERLEGNLGVRLPASNQWELVAYAAVWLVPIHNHLVEQAACGRLVQNDDTRMLVLSLRKGIQAELEADPKGHVRTGINTTAILSELEDGHRIALYCTGRQHAGENLRDLLIKRPKHLDTPGQMCDGLDRNLPKELKTILANCLAHARRKYVDAVVSFPVECRYVLEVLATVFHNDEKTRTDGLSPEQRLQYHQAHSAPAMEELRVWMKGQIEQRKVEPHSSLGNAIQYMVKRWEPLTRFLRCPGMPLHNNLCERALKTAVLNRKNAYFYKTENGARVGDLYMSLIHTAELAGANAFHYLCALLEHAKAVELSPQNWLPWNYQATLELANADTS